MLEWVAVSFSRDLPQPGYQAGLTPAERSTPAEPPRKPGVIGRRTRKAGSNRDKRKQTEATLVQ